MIEDIERLKAILAKLKVGMAFILIWCAVFILVTYGSVSSHEKVHTKIFEDYNVNSSMHYEFHPLATNRIAYVEVESNEQYYQNCNETCKSLHTLNEVVSYNLQETEMYIGVSVLLIGILLIFLFYNPYVSPSSDRKDLNTE